MAVLWTSAEAGAATGGRVTQPWQAGGVSIDTRNLRPGDLFVALKDSRDGHDFVADALQKGAAAALVDHIPDGVDETAPLLVVDDVLAALRALARAARARCRAKVIGVTGSVGKTSTKEMLRVMLGAQSVSMGCVHVAEASYNNHWGVPLTLARMPVDADFAVVEIGMNHPGEIAPLAQMAQLDVALITTVAPAHLFAFENIAAIAREKADIFTGLRKGGMAIIPADLEVTPILAAKARETGAVLRLFGVGEGADYRLRHVQQDAQVAVAQMTHDAGKWLFRVQSPGRHFVMNALGALAVGDVLGLDPALCAQAIGRWLPPAGRGQRERIMLDALDDLSFDLIDDAFNANPASMAAGLEVLALMPVIANQGRLRKGRRIAVLGDMLELGPTEETLHRDIAADPALDQIDLVHCVGPRMRALYQALPAKKRGRWVESAAELALQAAGLVDAGDVVLVKGSKGIKVHLIVEALRKLGQSHPLLGHKGIL